MTVKDKKIAVKADEAHDGARRSVHLGKGRDFGFFLRFVSNFLLFSTRGFGTRYLGTVCAMNTSHFSLMNND